MEEETRSVSGFLHFDTVSKGLCHLSTHFNQILLPKYSQHLVALHPMNVLSHLFNLALKALVLQELYQFC